MFIIDKKEYRNLQEQVLKNKEDIAAHYAIDRVLAEFGIRVIGVIPTYEDLIEQHENYQGEYGDAFAVGTQPPYIFYIWTRPDPAAGHDTAYWFNVGELAIVGPQGIPGTSVTNAALNADNQLIFTFSDGRTITIPRSLKGEPGGSPSITLTSTGEGVIIKVFSPEGTLEQSATVRNGANGQSIQGPPGAPGSAIIFKGIITAMSQLDGVVPETDNDAYILDDGTNRYIIGLVNGNWTNLGLFAGGSVVMVDGIIQNEWNADTKVNTITDTGGGYKLYGVNPSGAEWNPTLRQVPQTTDPKSKYQIALYDITTGSSMNNGLIRIAQTPLQPYHTASKQYVDTKVYNSKVLQSCIATFANDCYISFYRSVDRNQVGEAYENLPTYNWQACSGAMYPSGDPIYAFQNYGWSGEDDAYITYVRYFDRENQIVQETTIYNPPYQFETLTLN